MSSILIQRSQRVQLFALIAVLSWSSSAFASPTDSIVDYLASKSRPTSLDYRKELWDKAFPFEAGLYRGTAPQNIRLLQHVRLETEWRVDLLAGTLADGAALKLRVVGPANVTVESDLRGQSFTAAVANGTLEVGNVRAGFHRIRILADGLNWTGLIIALPTEGNSNQLTLKLLGGGAPAYDKMVSVVAAAPPNEQTMFAAYKKFWNHLSADRLKNALKTVGPKWLTENTVALTKSGAICLVAVPTGVGSGACLASLGANGTDLLSSLFTEAAIAMERDGLINDEELSTLKTTFTLLNAGAQALMGGGRDFSKLADMMDKSLAALDALTAEIESDNIRLVVKVGIQFGQKTMTLIQVFKP